MRRPGALLTGSLLYLSVVFGVMLWRGISIEPEWVVLALLVIAIAMGRGLTFIADWGRFILLFFAYEAMRGLPLRPGFRRMTCSDSGKPCSAGPFRPLRSTTPSTPSKP